MSDQKRRSIRILPVQTASQRHPSSRWRSVLAVAASLIGFALAVLFLAYAPVTPAMAAPAAQGLPTLPGGLPTLPNLCGDGRCGPLENGTSCPQDCAASCGDGICGDGEDMTTCIQDCVNTSGFCGDGTCAGGETGETCARDCALAETATQSETGTTTPTQTTTPTATPTETQTPTSTVASAETEAPAATPVPAEGDEDSGGGLNLLLMIGGALALLVLLGGIGGALLLARRGGSKPKPTPGRGASTPPAPTINEYETMPGVPPSSDMDQTHAGGVRTGRYERTSKDADFDGPTEPDMTDDSTKY